MASNCPICNCELEEHDNYESYVLCEYDATCPNKCYWENFSYGYYKYWVKHVFFCWSYHETREESQARQDAIELVIERNKVI